MQLSTVLLLLATAAAVYADCPDNNKFRLCYNKYLESFDLASSPWPEYRAFKMVREMLLVEKGPAGQTVECNYQNALISCLGDTANACVTTDNFKTVFSVSEDDAANYVEDYFMMQYTCTTGFSDAIKYFYCMEQVGLYYPTKLEKCTRNKQDALSGSNPDTCKAYDDFITCLVAVFVEHCGADITTYMCNLEVDGAVAAVPQCKDQIQKCPAPTSFLTAIFQPKYTRREALHAAFELHKRGGSVFL